MDINQIQQALSKSRQETGQRYAEIPNLLDSARKSLYGEDNTLRSLQQNESAKLAELFSHDRASADRYANPSSQMYLEDPYAREKAVSMRTMATAGQLGDIRSRKESRKNELGDALEKGLKMLEYGIKAKEFEQNSLQQEFNNQLALQKFDFEKSQATAKNSDSGMSAIQALLGLQSGKKRTPIATNKDGTIKYAEPEQATSDPSTMLGQMPPELQAMIMSAPESSVTKSLTQKWLESKMITPQQKPMTADQRKKKLVAEDAMQMLSQFNENYSRDKLAYAQSFLQGMGDTQARALRESIDSLMDTKMREKTGAALNEQEQAFYKDQMVDWLKDTPESVIRKMSNLEWLYKRLYSINTGIDFDTGEPYDENKARQELSQRLLNSSQQSDWEVIN